MKFLRNTASEFSNFYTPANTQGDDGHNVILIISDTLSANHMSLYGYHRPTTPFLENFFGKHGIVYDHARSTASWTLPSFASLMRSKMPSDIYTKDLIHDETAFPSVLRSHNIPIVAFLRDFGKPIAILQSIALLFKPEEYTTFPYHDYETPFQKASEWLHNYATSDKHNKRPFFLFIHDTSVHNPYGDTPQKYRGLWGGKNIKREPIAYKKYLMELGNNGKQVPQEEKERIILLYDHGVRYLDDILKKFIESIPKKVTESSVIIFTSDHGDEFGDHGDKFNHGQSLYEDLIHIPLAVKTPRNTACRIKTPVSLLDLAPTILSLFNIAPPKEYAGDVFPIQESSTASQKTICAEGRLTPFIRATDLPTIDSKYLRRKIISPLQQLTLIKKGGKLTIINKKVELYNIAEDPQEKNNLKKDLV